MTGTQSHWNCPLIYDFISKSPMDFANQIAKVIGLLI